ncbi:FMN-binding protein [Gemmiger formicilis]|uniref:FMN-binding protein n=1 Tax=Gemmiger formicilis TaxID=745368 RepID=UPI00195C806D|nr:FMN-binding protein [Gemmiger formicilis]
MEGTIADAKAIFYNESNLFLEQNQMHKRRAKMKIGFAEILVILGVALLVFGPDKTSTTKTDTASDGNTYTATATGIGDVTVTITVEDGKLVKVDVDTSNEIEGIGRHLGSEFTEQILQKGSVDAVSGATVTSKAVQEALAECLKQAGL